MPDAIESCVIFGFYSVQWVLARCLWPICMCFHDRSAKRRNREHARQRNSRQPEPKTTSLPRRRRALTLPRSDSSLKLKPWRKATTIDSQSGSSLLTKLPFEVRQMIWVEVVGEKGVHCYVSSRFGTLRGQMCGPISPLPKLLRYGEETNPWRNPGYCYCISWEPVFGRKFKRKMSMDEERVEKKDLIALPFTCRAIYSEVIPIIYTTIYFSFPKENDFALANLPRFLRPQRLTLIRNLYFQTDHFRDPPLKPTFSRLILRKTKYEKEVKEWTDYDLWHSIWRVLGSLTALQFLSVEIQTVDGLKRRKWHEYEDEALEPIKQVQGNGMKRFDLVLTWKEKEGGKVAKNLNCSVIRVLDGTSAWG